MLRTLFDEWRLPVPCLINWKPYTPLGVHYGLANACGVVKWFCQCRKMSLCHVIVGRTHFHGNCHAQTTIVHKTDLVNFSERRSIIHNPSSNHLLRNNAHLNIHHVCLFYKTRYLDSRQMICWLSYALLFVYCFPSWSLYSQKDIIIWLFSNTEATLLWLASVQTLPSWSFQLSLVAAPRGWLSRSLGFLQCEEGLFLFGTTLPGTSSPSPKRIVKWLMACEAYHSNIAYCHLPWKELPEMGKQICTPLSYLHI